MKSFAGELEMQPHKLYYHFNLLEKHKLIKVIETRVVSGIIEKRYQAVAKNFSVDEGLFLPTSKIGSEAVDFTLQGIFESCKSEFKKSYEAGLFKIIDGEPRKDRLIHTYLRLTAEEFKQFSSHIDELFKQIQAHRSGSPDEEKTVYSFTVAFFPTTKPILIEDEIKKE